MRPGIYLLALGTAAAGIFDLIWGEFESAHQPIQAWGDHIPGQQVFAYITAIWLIAAGAAILWRVTARAGAAATAIIYFIFTLFWLPRFYTAHHILGYRAGVYVGVLAGACTQVIVVAAAVLVYVSLAARKSFSPRTVLIARWIIGLSTVDFGLAHLAGVKENAVLVPKWMPLGGDFWTIVTGICFVLAGTAIVSGILDVLASRLLTLMLLVFSAVALVPLIIADPHDHTAWGANAYNLAAVGSIWIFADSIANRPEEWLGASAHTPTSAA